MHPFCDPGILILGIYPREMKKDLYSIVLSSFLIIAKKKKKNTTKTKMKQKNRKQASVQHRRGINCGIISHRMEYYPARQRNKLLMHATTWINHKNIIVNEILIQKRTY